VSAEPFGVYVHIPFCARRCDYCAFVTYVGVDELHGRYVHALLAELLAVQRDQRIPPASSVYFGGGTPSRLEPALVDELLVAIPRLQDCEVTLELNPEDVDPARLAAYVASGVTRFSLGVQSTSPRVLEELGRVHAGEDLTSLAATVASSGVASWSADLIVGAVGERDEDLLASLEAVVGGADRPPHISCYLLSVEKGTPLGRHPERHPDEDVLAHRYELVDAYLGAQGYRWYEVSNWSLPGHESRHNQLYWSQGSYLGLGCAAHGHRGGERSWNVASLTTYLKRVEAGQSPRAGFERTDEHSKRFEALALRLRTRRGIAAEELGDVAELAGYLVECEGRWVLTRSGRLLANEIIQRVDAAMASEEGGGAHDH
jgi:oxygen-independent coproporphyrinogen-3 oxidase